MMEDNSNFFKKNYPKITVRLLQGGGSVDLKNDC